MFYKVVESKALPNLLRGVAQGPWRAERAIRAISTDTRSLKKDDLFLALQGERFDGHQFVEEALARGAGTLVLSRLPKEASAKIRGCNVLLVRDTLAAYGELAKAYRQALGIPVVAVTGSAGKTTVKEMIAALLSQRFRVCKTEQTENNLVGVPKTILKAGPETEVLVLELGTNQPGEIERLSGIAGPTVGVLTQVGTAHLEGLKNLEGVRREKLSLLKGIAPGGTVVVNGESEPLKALASPGHRVRIAGFTPNKDGFSASDIQLTGEGTDFQMTKLGKVHVKLLGRHNVLNVLLAALAADSLGLAAEHIRQGMGEFRPAPGRLQPKKIGELLFLDDSYNANPDSFRAALELLALLPGAKRRGLVCGDMLELGGRAVDFHRELGKEIARSRLDYVIAAGPLSEALAKEALKNGLDSSKIEHVKGSREAAERCRAKAKPGDLILIKGSRGMQMEKVFECFTTSSTP